MHRTNTIPDKEKCRTKICRAHKKPEQQLDIQRPFRFSSICRQPVPCVSFRKWEQIFAGLSAGHTGILSYRVF